MPYDEYNTITGSHRRRCVETPQELKRSHWVARVALSPVMRLDDVPPWGWLTAALAAGVQRVTTDAFLSLLALLFVAISVDYVIGWLVAKHKGRYEIAIARAGALGKVIGIILLLLVRGLEHWISTHAPESLSIPNSHGMFAAAFTMLFLTVELQSIEQHRQELGLRPIPALSALFAWMERFARAKVPMPPVPASAADEEDR